MSNLTVAIIEHLHGQGQSELAQQIAGQAHGVLLNYDEDMAEHVRTVGQTVPPDEPEYLPTLGVVYL